MELPELSLVIMTLRGKEGIIKQLRWTLPKSAGTTYSTLLQNWCINSGIQDECHVRVLREFVHCSPVREFHIRTWIIPINLLTLCLCACISASLLFHRLPYYYIKDN